MIRQYLKAQLWVLMCGGLLGPLWLFVYFAFLSDDRQYVAWMYWIGLAITALNVPAALIVARYQARSAAELAGFRATSAAKDAALEQNGVLAIAQITGLAETATTINDHPLVDVSMHIAGPGFAFDGQERLLATVTTTGSLNARKLVVIVDPDTHDFEVDWQGSALVNGLVAARFTVTEDNKTYDLTGQAEPLLEILQVFKDNGIPHSGPSDLRSGDPALRKQLNDMVRRAAATRSAPAYAAGGPGVNPRPSAAQRLQELAGLHANEAITDDEYERKRAQIIAEI